MATSHTAKPWWKLKRVWTAVVAVALIAGMALGGIEPAEVGHLTDLAETVIEQFEGAPQVGEQ